jgi:4-hydroxyphenylpyruvate dioxygenase-like putative hemolysin
LLSLALGAADGKIRFPLDQEAGRSSQIEEYLMQTWSDTGALKKRNARF